MLPHLQDSLPLQQRLGLVAVANAVLTLYLHATVARVAPGALRVLLSIPVFFVLLLVPTLFSAEAHEILVRTSFLFAGAWLGSFKVLALCLNRGPLARPHLSLIQFSFLLLLPIYPAAVQPGGPQQQKSVTAAKDAAAQEEELKKQGRLDDNAGGPLHLLGRALAKTTLLGVIAYLLLYVPMPRLIKDYVYSFGMVGFLGIIMDAPASVVTGLVGLSIIPTFDAPWWTTSLADFWGRRWNITTSSVLRTLVYDPIVEGRLIKPASEKVSTNKPLASSTKAESANGSAKGTQNGSSSDQRDPTANGEPAGPQVATNGTHKGSTAALNGSSSTDSLNGGAGINESKGDTVSTNGNGSSSTEASSGSKGKGGRSASLAVKTLGMCATFVASGLAHEYIIYMLQDRFWGPWTWKWTMFFVLQGPLLTGETLLRRVWKRNGLPQPHPYIARAITYLVLLTVGGKLFYAPVEKDSDVADRVVSGVVIMFQSLAKLVSLSHPKVAQLMDTIQSALAPASKTA